MRRQSRRNASENIQLVQLNELIRIKICQDIRGYEE